MGVHYTGALLDRYFQLGSQLTFLMRSRAVGSEDAARYTPLVEDGFQFVPVPNVKGPLKGLIHGGALVRVICAEVERHDVVVVRLPSTIGRWTFWEARRQGKPVLVEFMACTWDTLWNYSWLGRLSAPYYFWKNIRLMRATNHVIYVTERFLQSRYPTAGKWIACSNVVVHAGEQVVLERRLERINRITDDRPLILATIAAVDVRYKNQETVFRALANMGTQAARFHYRVIGQGNPQRLVSLARRYGVADRVEFVGAVRHAEIPRWLDDTDVYIQPSRMEGLPRALIEAMSRGCPALGSSAGGIPELLAPDRIFKKGDAVDLAHLLCEYSTQKMRLDATRNWERAFSYTDETLKRRRSDFFNEFLQDAGLFCLSHPARPVHPYDAAG